MSVRTATGGKADWSTDGVTYANIPEVRKWTMTITRNAKEYASSSTGGGKRKLAGAENFDGSLDVYHDADNRLHALGMDAGVTGYLKLWEDDTDFYIAPVYLDDVSTDVDIEGEGLVEGAVSFSRDGALTYPA